MPNIKLRSSDGKIFEVDVEIAKVSVTIKTMLDIRMDVDEDVITLPDVDSPILKLVIQWATYHRYDPLLAEDDNKEIRTEDIIPWDADFLKVDPATIIELNMAAHYLGIKGLFNVTYKILADMSMGKTPEENAPEFLPIQLVELPRKRKLARSSSSEFETH